MLFAIYCLDAEGAAAKREQYYPQHRAYLDTQSSLIRLAGPVTKGDGVDVVGSLFIVECESLAQAEEFNRNDPFHKNAVWKTANIHGFLQRRPKLG
jgi:uncharacterized protein YciI